MKITCRYFIVGSDQCPNTKLVKDVFQTLGIDDYGFIDVEHAKWLKVILSKSQFEKLPIVFDENYDLIGDVDEVIRHVNNTSSSDHHNRVSKLIKMAIERQANKVHQKVTD